MNYKAEREFSRKYICYCIVSLLKYILYIRLSKHAIPLTIKVEQL